MTKTIERMSAYRVPLEPMRPTSGWRIAFLVGSSEPHLMDGELRVRTSVNVRYNCLFVR